MIQLDGSVLGNTPIPKNLIGTTPQSDKDILQKIESLEIKINKLQQSVDFLLRKEHL